MTSASEAQVDQAVHTASGASVAFRDMAPARRAEFLRACAGEIEALGDVLVDRVMRETGYPRMRVDSEHVRTCNQLRMFADYIEAGKHFDASIDTAQPEREPVPRPDLRFMYQAVGPVAVFGAGNFPLAFSVAGGDTAAALAAGCPVLVKGHPSHPGTCELVARAMAWAAERCGMPAGVFSLLMDAGTDAGARLVQAPQVRAVAFTGSFQGGMALYGQACRRPEPIPVFAEMGSLNPVVLLPGALRASAQAIGRGLVASMTLGTGQFCVKPGLIFALAGDDLEPFAQAVATTLAEVAPGVMLNERIWSSYSEGLQGRLRADGVTVAAQGPAVPDENGFRAQACLLRIDADAFLQRPDMQQELFGPAAMLVECRDRRELLCAIAALGGQLTGTVHCAGSDAEDYRELFGLLAAKVGRIVVNGFPTGVEVCPSMAHGGPFPASTDARFSSVGTAAIRRFQRPVCYQNCPPELLPGALKDENPLCLLRTVNGQLTRGPLP